jgi:hypothetical protein
MGRLVSLIYGFAAALTSDEFVLWLDLREVYWDREVRVSIGVVLSFGTLLSIAVYGFKFYAPFSVKCLVGAAGSPAHATDAYAFATYWATIRCVLKNDPLSAIVYRITSP